MTTSPGSTIAAAEKPKVPEVKGKKSRKEWPANTSPRRWLGLRGNRLIVAITTTATMGFLLFGYDQGVMSGIINAEQFGRAFPLVASSGPSDTYAAEMQGTVTAVYEVGCFFGAIFAFFYAEFLGRRRMMFLGSFIMVAGTVIQVAAMPGHGAFRQFVVGRIITGVGNGANTSTIPSWVAECTKSHNRGLLICIEASMVAVGTLIAYWTVFGISYVDSDVSWRFPIALQILFAIFMCFGVAILPESPRWLFIHGHYDRAAQIVADLNDQELEDEDSQRQIRIIVEGIDISPVPRPSWGTRSSGRHLKGRPPASCPATCLGCALTLPSTHDPQQQLLLVPPLDSMSAPVFTPEMLQALAQPPPFLQYHHQLQQQQRPAQALSSTAQAAAAVAAFLAGQAQIVFPSQDVADNYHAAAVAGAGVGAGGDGGREGQAWRQARAIEALLLQSGQQLQHQHIPAASWQAEGQQQRPGLYDPLFQRQQPVLGLVQHHLALQHQFASLAGTVPKPNPAGTLSHTTLAAYSPILGAAATSPPSSSGDSSASSPLLSVASLSSHRGSSAQPHIYSGTSTASTVDPFDLSRPSQLDGGADAGSNILSGGLNFKDLFGFSPAVAFGGSFADGGPAPQQQQQPQKLELSALSQPQAVPYVSDAVASSASVSPAPAPLATPTAAAVASASASTGTVDLAAAQAAHFAWNQSVNSADPKKRHVCAVCARGFARAFNLKSHMATHDQNRPKPFACPHAGCGRGFSRSHDLERHRVGIHQDSPEDAAVLPPRAPNGRAASVSFTSSSSPSLTAGAKAKQRSVRGAAAA